MIPLMAAATGQTDQMKNIYPLLLALILIFILPMLMRRTGLTWSDLTARLFGSLGKKSIKTAAQEGKQGNGREPYLSNGTKGELTAFLSSLITIARRHKIGIIYPGTVSYGGQTATLLALLVTKSRVIGFNCFGFGGTVSRNTGNPEGEWIQHMNGQDLKIPNPVRADAEQNSLVRSAMDSIYMKEVPLEICAVYTNSHVVTGNDYRKIGVYTTEQILSYINEVTAEEDRVFDPQQTAEKLNRLVVHLKPAARQKRQ